jgi:hypothetical protein
VQRRVQALDSRFALGRREGSKRAREKYGPVGVSSLRPDLSMDLVQIDHTLIGLLALVIVVDRPKRASWLDEREKQLVLADLEPLTGTQRHTRGRFSSGDRYRRQSP